MQFAIFTDVNKFYDSTYDLFMCHEAQNLIPLGNIIIGKEGKDKTGWRDPASWFMATVSDNTCVQLVAIMTPPHNITLYSRDNKIDESAITCLIAGIDNVPVPGVMAKKDMALYFAQTFCSAKNLPYETVMEQRIYELTKVNHDIPHIGTMRLVEDSDMYFLPYWLEAFYSAEVFGKTTMNIPQDAEQYLHRIRQKKMYVLEEQGKPVSLAGATRELQTVCGVANVYTPPYFRGKGYASSCVARLSQMILDRGFTKCVLYTDLANPTSNSIYQKIGYCPICDSVMLKFVQKS
jgi:RimJ/RimL family protein N-acetyltransferase